MMSGLASNTTRPEDEQNYTLLMAELRSQLDAQGLLDGRHYLLTMAAPAGPGTYANVELSLIHQYTDWINIMTYDFHGGWSPITNFNSALHASSNDPSSDPVIASQFNMASAVQAYLAAGVPSDKKGMSSSGSTREITPLFPWRPAILSPICSLRLIAT